MFLKSFYILHLGRKLIPECCIFGWLRMVSLCIQICRCRCHCHCRYPVKLHFIAPVIVWVAVIQSRSKIMGARRFIEVTCIHPLIDLIQIFCDTFSIKLFVFLFTLLIAVDQHVLCVCVIFLQKYEILSIFIWCKFAFISLLRSTVASTVTFSKTGASMRWPKTRSAALPDLNETTKLFSIQLSPIRKSLTMDNKKNSNLIQRYFEIGICDQCNLSNGVCARSKRLFIGFFSFLNVKNCNEQ